MSMMIRRKMLLIDDGILPGDYKQVAYIECSGTQYVLTDYIAGSDNISIEWTYMLTVTQSGDQYMFGASAGSAAGVRYQRIGAELYANDRWYVDAGRSGYSNPSTLQAKGARLNTKYDASCTVDKLTVDGYEGSPSITYQTGRDYPKFAIFAFNNTGTINYIDKGLRIYKLMVYEDGELAANFVPCYRKRDGEIGFYDTVGEAFYGNSGTGDLIKGPDA